MSSTVIKVFRFISLLKLEVVLGLFFFCRMIKVSPLEVLIQDKLCRNKYNMTYEYCRDLSIIDEDDPNYKYKTQILSDAVNYNMYHNLISMIPGILLPLFYGPWTDRYLKAKKVIMLIGSITMSMEAFMNVLNSYFFHLDPKWILVSFIPYTFSGSIGISVCYTYLGATTPKHLMTIRMTVMEIIKAFVQPSGTFIAGQLINKLTIGSSGQIHNYCLLFSIASSTAFFVFIWVLFMIDEERDRLTFAKHFPNEPQDRDDKEAKYSIAESDRHRHPLRLLFDISNVKQIVVAFFKKRPNNVREQIWLLQCAMFCGNLVQLSPEAFQFQFVEKVYNWDAKQYSFVQSIGNIVNSIVSLLVIPILMKYLKLTDILVAVVGFIGLYSDMMVKATVLSPFGFYLSLCLSCTGTLAYVGTKSHLYKTISPNDIGKVFMMITVIDSLTPILSSTLFASIFRSTIDTIPGMCHFIIAFAAFLAIQFCMIIDYVSLSNRNKKLAT